MKIAPLELKIEEGWNKMSKKKNKKRIERTLKGKTRFDPRGKKGVGEIYPWHPAESPELPPLTVKKEVKPGFTQEDIERAEMKRSLRSLRDNEVR